MADVVHVGGDWGFVPAYRGVMAELVPSERESEVMAAARARGAKLIQVSQITPRAKHQFARGVIEGIDRRIGFPELRFWALSPQLFRESFKVSTSVDRIFELDLSSIGTSQKKSEFPIDMVGYVEREASKRPLFHTVTHAGGQIVSRLVQGLAELLSPDLDTSALYAAAAELDRSEGLNYDTDHPLSAEVRGQLGFDWGPSYDVYEEMLNATSQKKWDLLLSNREKYEELFRDDSQYWKACAMLGSALKDDAIALPALARLLEWYPGLTGPWLQLGFYLKQMRREDQIVELIAKAERSMAELSLFHSVASRLYLLVGDSAKAEMHARTFWQRSKNRNAMLPLLYILLQQNRRDEAKELFATLRTRLSIDQEVVRKALQRLPGGPELQADFEAILLQPSYPSTGSESSVSNPGEVPPAPQAGSL